MTKIATLVNVKTNSNGTLMLKIDNGSHYVFVCVDKSAAQEICTAIKPLLEDKP